MKPFKRCSIFTNEIDDKIISSIKESLKTYYSIRDFTVFSDSIIQNISPEYAVLPSFYLSFYKGVVVFDSHDSYLSKQNILGDNHVAYELQNGTLQYVIR